MNDDLIERLQCWVNDLDQTDHGWQECSDAITRITELEEKLTLSDILIRANTKVGTDE